MFSAGGFFGLNLGHVDLTAERDPPSPPTPVTFPRYPSHDGPPARWSAEQPPPRLSTKFASIFRSKDVDESFLHALNVQMCAPTADHNAIIPRVQDGRSFYPDWELEDHASPDRYVNPLAPQNRREPLWSEAVCRKDFLIRIAELRTPNSAAFHALNKTTPKDQPPVRLAQLRKFFMQLENMSHYWDASADNYFWKDDDAQDSEDSKSEDSGDFRLPHSPKRRRTSVQVGGHDTNNSNHVHPDSDDGGDESDDDVQIIETREHSSNPNDEATTSPDDNAATSTSKETPSSSGLLSATTTALLADIPITPLPKPQPRFRYTGLRLGTGLDMPESYRTDALYGFLEPIVWRFGCTMISPRLQPAVKMANLQIPVRQTGVVYVFPNDQTQRRSGIVEGPVMGVCGRSEIFEHDSESGPRNDERGHHIDPQSALDLLREIGPLLQLAQERHREGRTEKRPGEGKWWTEKPRWGGLPGPDEYEELRAAKEALAKLEAEKSEAAKSAVNGTGGETAEGESADPATPNGMSSFLSASAAGNRLVSSALSADSDALGQARSRLTRLGAKRRPPREMWRELKVGRSLWDSKVHYRAVGKQKRASKSSDTDETLSLSDSPQSQAEARPARDQSVEMIDVDDQEQRSGAAGDDDASIRGDGVAEDVGDWDDVFLLSSLNHHVSVVRLTVHNKYLDFLETGELPPSSFANRTMTNGALNAELNGSPSPSTRHWSSPLLQRSPWYDLLDVEQRCEAFRLVWGVMAYMMRDERYSR